MSELSIREPTASPVPDLIHQLWAAREHNLKLAEALALQRAHNAKLQLLMQPHKATTSFPRVNSGASIASTAADWETDATSSLCGASDLRWAKILKYKAKQRRHRERVAISRQFRGRSQVAKTKPRVNGKFVKAG